MSFVKDWNNAIDADPYWQFEELLEEDPELAEAVWEFLNIKILVRNTMVERHGVYLP